MQKEMRTKLVYLNYSYRSVLYFLWLVKEILVSSLVVIKIIWRRNLNLDPVFEWIESEQENDTALVIYANSITLTPGTATVDVSNGMLLVYALDQSMIDSLKFGNTTMAKKVNHILK